MPPSAPETRRPAHDGRLRVALAVDRFDWHARELTRAFGALGVSVVPFRLSTSRFDTTAKHGLRIRGFGADLPDATIVRAVSGGTFQAVTMRLGILHALRELGVPVWNDARAVERCVDKSTTSFLLAKAGIPTPATWCVESPEAAREVAQRETAGGPLVLKPLFGSQGRGLQLVAGPDDLPPSDAVAGVYYLQRFVGVERDGFRDMRLLTLRGRVVAAMARHSAHWITNVKQGGRPVALVADSEVKALALAAAEAVGADFAGVDILRDSRGRALVLEVNSMPAWRGLQQVTPHAIAPMIARELVDASGPPERTRGSGLNSREAEIADAFVKACLAELEAPKPGNVHIFADGHTSTVEDFRRSAEVAAGPIARSRASVGERILGAIEATRAAVGQNTNLGIVLLCAPLARAAETPAWDLRDGLARALANLDRRDAKLAFRAIALAAPAGLGDAARHDVREPPSATLLEAMAEAAARDRIARQYSSGFADVFDLGGPTLEAAARRWPDRPAAATLLVYLRFLSAFPDSHVERKHGAEVARGVCREASELHAFARDAVDPDALWARSLSFDASLKQRRLNPGTSADLTVATLFARRLRGLGSTRVH